MKRKSKHNGAKRKRKPKPVPAATLIRSERERLGMTQMEFAGHLGVSRRTMIRWEGGEPVPAHVRTLIALMGKQK